MKYNITKIVLKFAACILLISVFLPEGHAQTMSRQNKLIIDKGIQYQSWLFVDHPIESIVNSTSIIGRSGRYIRVQLGSTAALNLAEVQVISGGVNLALGKSTRQSSNVAGGGGTSNLAVDGNTSGIYSNGSVTQTLDDRSQIEPWWEVDLGRVVNIDNIKLWNRSDCCTDQLKGYYLFVSDVPYVSNNLAGTLAQSGVSRYVGGAPKYNLLGADLDNTKLAPTYYDQPFYNYNTGLQNPGVQWSLANFSRKAGAVRAVREPSTFEKTTTFLNSLQKANINKLSSICFGDEEDYSLEAQNYLTQWFSASKLLYPNVLVHNSQYFGQYSESILRTFMQAAKPDMLTYDLYYFNFKTTVPFNGSHARLFQDMMRYRKVALEGYDGTGSQPIVYGAYLQGFYGMRDTEDYKYNPSESEVNLGAYAYLLLGAKWLNVWRFYGNINAPYDWRSTSGNFLPTYFTYARIGKEVSNLSPHLSRLQSTDVRFIPGQNNTSGAVANNPMPVGIAAWDAAADPYIKSITATNLVPTTNSGLRGDVAVGYFKPVASIDNTPGVTMSPVRHKNAKYFMLMNALARQNGCCNVPAVDTLNRKASFARQKIELFIDFGASPIDTLYRVNRNTGIVQQIKLIHYSGKKFGLIDTLDGGMADLFFWKNAGKVSGSSSAIMRNNLNMTTSDICASDTSKSNIYSNPVQGILNMDLIRSSESEITTLISNSVGKIVFQKKTISKSTNQLEIDFTDQTPGVYILQIEDAHSKKLYKVIET